MVVNMKRILFSFLLLIIVATGCRTDEREAALNSTETPRLLVVVSFDQMRADYLSRWRELWSEDGFAQLLRDGRNYSNCAFTHSATATGPGHSILSTGAYPAKNGIVLNNFYDRQRHRDSYAVDDSKAKILGAGDGQKGRSPRNLQMPTLGDWLKKSDSTARVIAISPKDRAAILMGGHRADAVLWFDRSTSAFTTSSYYSDSLPRWLHGWTAVDECKRYSSYHWNAALADEAYSVPDEAPGEGAFPGGTARFPHQLPDLSTATSEAFFKSFFLSPPSVDIVFNLAKKAIEAEQLGKRQATDILWLGISTTDYVGHQFGPDSREIVDTYLQCDRMIADLIAYLDDEIGRDRYLLAVSSDHGVAPIPEQSAAAGLDAGRIDQLEFVDELDAHLSAAFPFETAHRWFDAAHLPHLYVNPRTLAATRNEQAVYDSIRAFAMRQEGVAAVLTRQDIKTGSQPPSVDAELFDRFRKNAFETRTGDVIICPKEYWIFGNTPATHGSPYDYDRAVPLIFFGAGVAPGELEEQVSPADLAPTLADRIGVAMPAVDGRVLALR